MCYTSTVTVFVLNMLKIVFTSFCHKDDKNCFFKNCFFKDLASPSEALDFILEISSNAAFVGVRVAALYLPFFIANLHCSRETNDEDFKRVRSSVLILFNKLNSLSTGVLENGNEATTSTNFVKFGYFGSSEDTFASLTISQYSSQVRSGSSFSSNTCSLHSPSSFLVSNIEFRYGNFLTTSAREDGTRAALDYVMNLCT